VSNASLVREYAQYKNERKMDELAIKGYQNQMAEKLRGSMGEDIKKSFEHKKDNAWTRFKKSFDNFLSMLQ
jgi:hypothetical protein